MPPSLSTLDFEQLLTPISPENPCGESLRWDPVWDEIGQLRKTRKDPLDASADKSPEWAKLVGLATDVLATRTKDLLIAGWLTEALVREHGFAGLRDGLSLIQGFVDRFWDGVYPIIEDGDLTNRAAPLSWLTSADGGARMPAAMREISLAQKSEPILNWHFWHLRRVAPIGKDEKDDAFKKRSAAAEQNRQLFDSTVDATPIVFYQTMLSDIDSCLTVIDQLSQTLDQKLADQAPNWTGLRNSIGEIRVFVYGTLKRRGGLVEESVASPQTEGETMSGSDAQPVVKSNNGQITTRGEAIAQLEAVARFFSTTEPHSPVAYLIRRAVRWAGMPFEEVLGELVKDDKLVKQIGETLGIVTGSSK